MLLPRHYQVNRVGLVQRTKWIHALIPAQQMDPNRPGMKVPNELYIPKSPKTPTNHMASSQEALRSFISGRITGLMSRVDAFRLITNRSAHQFGRKLNQVTGYEGIEAFG